MEKQLKIKRYDILVDLNFEQLLVVLLLFGVILSIVPVCTAAPPHPSVDCSIHNCTDIIMFY